MSEELPIEPQPIDIVLSQPQPIVDTSTNISKSRNTKNNKMVKGNKLSTGQPFLKEYAKFKSAFVKSISKEDVEILTKKLIDQAKKGSFHHQKLALELLIGKPRQELDVTVNQLSASEVTARINLIFGLIQPEETIDPTTDLKTEEK